jgi:tetratricopeptide (TPR) repeat protein
MLELWFKLKASAKVVAWAAPHVQQWHKDRVFNRVEGNRQLEARNFAEAEECLAEAVEECGERGSSPNTRIRLQLQLAEAQRKQGDDDPDKLDEAEVTIRDALQLTARISNPSGYVQCLDALVEVFYARGDLPGMQALIEEGIRIEAAMPHPDPIRMARRVHRLGLVLNFQGEDGIPVLEKSIRLHEQSFGEDHVETAGVLADTGIFYRATGHQEQAQTCLNRALRIHRRDLGADSPEAIRDLQYLAGSHEESGDFDSASEHYERALELTERLVGIDQEELAELQFRMACLYADWEHYSRARELLAMCIGTFRRKKGARLAIAYELVAHVEERSGRYRDALIELERAGRTWEACGPERAEELAKNLEYRADLQDQMKRKDSANWLRERAAETRAAAAGTT